MTDPKTENGDDRARYVLRRAPMAMLRIMQLTGCERRCERFDCPCAVSGMAAALTEDIYDD